MLQQDFQYFISNQEELAKQHEGKILVIKDQKVIGVFNDILDAYFTTQQEHELGSFLIQPCEFGANAYTATIRSID